MINTVVVEKKLREKYSDIECVTSGIYKAIDKYAGREYAIHFFDLTDEIMSKVDKLGQFQEEILSETYFSGKAFTDLRWNHYLHFVISAAVSKSENFNHVKTKIESDKEYARKSVILENEIDSFLTEPPVSYQKVPEDITSIWINRLEKYGLTYVLDEDITVPKAAREIASGRKDKAQSIITPSMLTPSEKVAAKCFLRNLSIKGFRPYPKRKTYKFGKVNLIVGNNGAGKTSLLEAIEYLFCGRNRRPSNLMDGTSVSAQFVDSDVTLETSVRTLSRQLFTRHSHWYAKTDIKKR